MSRARTYPEGVTSWIDVEEPDLGAARVFYAELFGWEFADDGDPAYLIARLEGQDVAGLAEGGDQVIAWNTYVPKEHLGSRFTRTRRPVSADQYVLRPT